MFRNTRISWSFHKDPEAQRCLVTGPELSIHRLNWPELDLVQCNSANTAPKCASWNPEFKDLFALGYSNGRISIGEQEQSKIHIRQEHAPSKTLRSCNSVVFSPDGKHLLAAMEKLRNHYGILIYDVQKPAEEWRPTSKFGLSDAACSACWLTANSILFLAGVSLGKILCCDSRLESTAFAISTKSIYGLANDPFSDTRFASYDDQGVIKIWDCRKTNEAILSFSNGQKSLGCITWSPDNPSYLASFNKDAMTVQVWCISSDTIPCESGTQQEYDDIETDLSLYGIHLDVTETLVRNFKPIIKTQKLGTPSCILLNSRSMQFNDSINDISWIQCSDKMMFVASIGTRTISKSHKLVTKSVKYACLFGISPLNSFAVTYDGSKLVEEDIYLLGAKNGGSEIDSRIFDCSEIIQGRAKKGYAFDASFNLEILESEEDPDPHLVYIWQNIQCI